MTALFRRQKTPAPLPTAPDPRDIEAQVAADLARRSAQKRGKASTVLTRLMDVSTSAGSAAPKTTLGGG